jgi:hypothetical protein
MKQAAIQAIRATHAEIDLPVEWTVRLASVDWEEIESGIQCKASEIPKRVFRLVDAIYEHYDVLPDVTVTLGWNATRIKWLARETR